MSKLPTRYWVKVADSDGEWEVTESKRYEHHGRCTGEYLLVHMDKGDFWYPASMCTPTTVGSEE
jgi:hypothetical protein